MRPLEQLIKSNLEASARDSVFREAENPYTVIAKGQGWSAFNRITGDTLEEQTTYAAASADCIRAWHDERVSKKAAALV
jgi:hypothetical protein